jgi:hypothetical protein
MSITKETVIGRYNNPQKLDIFQVVVPGDEGVLSMDFAGNITPTPITDSNATEIQGIPVNPTPPSHNGEILIFDSVSNTYIAGDPLVSGLAPAGSAAVGNPVQIGTVVSTDAVVPSFANGVIVPLPCDTAGSVYTNATGRQPTYRACQSAFIPIADPVVPFFTIQGSATRIVKVRHIKISWACTTGNAAPNVIRLRRFSVISGGTPNVVTPTPDDILNPAATAVLNQYSVLPTTATPYNAGVLSSEYMQWTTNTATLVGPVAIQWDFGVNSVQSFTLRGVNDWFGLEIAAVAASNPLMAVRVTWTEE